MSKLEKQLGRKRHSDERRKGTPDRNHTTGQNKKELHGYVEWVEVRKRRIEFQAKNATELDHWLESTVRKVRQIPDQLRNGYSVAYRLKLYDAKIRGIEIRDIATGKELKVPTPRIVVR